MFFALLSLFSFKREHPFFGRARAPLRGLQNLFEQHALEICMSSKHTMRGARVTPSVWGELKN